MEASLKTAHLIRLYLALLLVLAPLWAPLGAAAADASAGSAEQMPCCPAAPAEADQPLQPASNQADSCGHCSGDGPMGQCQCCVFASAATMPALEVSAHSYLKPEFFRVNTAFALPAAPPQAPFRPPIRSL